jgi:hypothetical protein
MAEYIPLEDIAKRFSGRRRSKAICLQSVWRWINRGLRGGPDRRPIKLKAAKIAGRWLTTSEWVDDFMTALAGDPNVGGAVVRSPHRRLKAAERAGAALRQRGA